ncbi:hypothetical protein [Selenomonas sp. GACV-9]|uniref:hypothetical protein n=1 Tax=Selenomonas sp. GACV-9 TaxID=3158782 RepID=UPI0015A6F289
MNQGRFCDKIERKGNDDADAAVIRSHLSRKYWYTLCLDGSIPMAELTRRIDASFVLSQPKKRR